MNSDAAAQIDNRDAVFNTIAATLRELAGQDIEVDHDSNLVTLLEEIGDSLDLFELVWGIEEQLGIALSQEELSAFFWPPSPGHQRTYKEWKQDVVPTLTVSAFVEFINQRLEPIMFEPISVLGSPPCPAAGYFVGMSEIVNQIKPNAERFGPSTPIKNVLPGHQLTTFWMRLSRAAGRSLPQLSFWLNHLANVVVIGSSACLLFGVFVNWAFLGAAWMLCLKGILFASWLFRRANPLPEGIVTFGDLARHLAGQKDLPASQSLSRRAGTWLRHHLRLLNRVR